MLHHIKYHEITSEPNHNNLITFSFFTENSRESPSTFTSSFNCFSTAEISESDVSRALIDCKRHSA